ncbi:hypothetical protein [Pseudomonas sp. B26(2017)]|uniref:hypothetical protein n=1 Tax=Pseudomonas sp. B26(2017) TaxID=1981732 RepID=UPI000A1E52EB|nr:hypothetical protein [Pseudomonas sp. B26(2017)]
MTNRNDSAMAMAYALQRRGKSEMPQIAQAAQAAVDKVLAGQASIPQALIGALVDCQVRIIVDEFLGRGAR